LSKALTFTGDVSTRVTGVDVTMATVVIVWRTTAYSRPPHLSYALGS